MSDEFVTRKMPPVGLPANKEYLTFTLSGEECALETNYIVEVIGTSAVTPLKNVPGYVKGVIGYRGNVIPIIDIRGRFDENFSAEGDFASVIIVKVNKLFMGVVVDMVGGVVDIEMKDVEHPKTYAADGNGSIIFGIWKNLEKIKVLLNAKNLLTDTDVQKFENLMVAKA